MNNIIEEIKADRNIFSTSTQDNIESKYCVALVRMILDLPRMSDSYKDHLISEFYEGKTTVYQLIGFIEHYKK